MIEIRTACSTTKDRQPRPRGWARNTARTAGMLMVFGGSVLCAVSSVATEVTQSVEGPDPRLGHHPVDLA